MLFENKQYRYRCTRVLRILNMHSYGCLEIKLIHFLNWISKKFQFVLKHLKSGIAASLLHAQHFANRFQLSTYQSFRTENRMLKQCQMSEYIVDIDP